jgi:hypothetical protein
MLPVFCELPTEFHFDSSSQLLSTVYQHSSLFFLMFSFSRAFTLSLPDKLNSGTLVTVQWSRDNGDPTSFGLMQRSLLGNQPVVSVTPVQNAAGDRSGTADVVFSTSGYVLTTSAALV